MEQLSYTSTHPLGHTGPVTGSLQLFTFLLYMLYILIFCTVITLKETVTVNKGSITYYLIVSSLDGFCIDMADGGLRKDRNM